MGVQWVTCCGREVAAAGCSSLFLLVGSFGCVWGFREGGAWQFVACCGLILHPPHHLTHAVFRCLLLPPWCVITCVCVRVYVCVHAQSDLVKRIAELVDAKQLDGISDVRDESDRTGAWCVYSMCVCLASQPSVQAKITVPGLMLLLAAHPRAQPSATAQHCPE